ncbi:hypothetical protein Tco_0540922 [Tanacetum coccineum]
MLIDTLGSSYHEGKLRIGKPELDGSSSLSPLITQVRRTILHVSIAAGLHQRFLGFASATRHSSPSFRVPTGIAPTLDPYLRSQERAGMGCPQSGCQDARSPGFGRRTIAPGPAPVDRADRFRRSTSDREHRQPHSLPPDNFKHYLNSLFKSQTTRLADTAPRGLQQAGRARRGSHHSPRRPLPGGLGPGAGLGKLPPDSIHNSDSEAARFSSWAVPGSLAVTKGILNKERGFLRPPLVRASIEGTPILANHTMSTGDQYPLPTKIWFDNDPSAGSPTETLLRLLLPLNDKVQWNSRDVAGSEPPTSPRS